MSTCPTCGEGFPVSEGVANDLREVKAAWHRLAARGIWTNYEGAGWVIRLGDRHPLAGTPAEASFVDELRAVVYPPCA